MDFNYSYTLSGGNFLMGQVLSLLFGLVCYVLSSIGLHTIARRRGISKPWLAWIPVVGVWILGSISDQYRYVTKGQIRNKRKVLLTMSLVTYVALFVMRLVARSALFHDMSMMVNGMADQVWMDMFKVALGILAAALVMLVFAIVQFVFYCMALNDLYVSVNPAYSTAFLVLSIIFRFTEPFFIFFNRNMDAGMPPRCEIPTAPVQPPVPEPWETDPEE